MFNKKTVLVVKYPINLDEPTPCAASEDEEIKVEAKLGPSGLSSWSREHWDENSESTEYRVDVPGSIGYHYICVYELIILHCQGHPYEMLFCLQSHFPVHRKSSSVRRSKSKKE